LILRNGGGLAIDQIRQLLRSGAVEGNGIISSTVTTATTIGYASGAVLVPGGGAFAGQSIAGPDLVLAFAVVGDANLDQTVGIGDFSVLGANFNRGGFWTDGDFDYDGQIGIVDFALLAANFNRTLADPVARQSVPEPGWAIPAAMLLLGRRRSASV
jgi:hypothetical protein